MPTADVDIPAFATPEEVFRRAWMQQYSTFVGPPTALAGLAVWYQSGWAWQVLAAVAFYIGFNAAWSHLEGQHYDITEMLHPRAWINGAALALLSVQVGHLAGAWVLVIPTVFGAIGSATRTECRYILGLGLCAFTGGSLVAGVEPLTLLLTLGGLLTIAALSQRLYRPLVHSAVESALRGQRLEEANTRLESTLDARKTFLATMSHEIRTPMNGVLGMAELLEGTPLNDEQRGMLHTLRGSGQGLLAVINDVLDLSKLEAGRLEIEAVSTDPVEVAESVAELLRHASLREGVALEVRARGLPDRVDVDALRLRQVLLNLVGNACKFTASGRISLRLAWTGQRLQVAVEDTGIGIAPEAQDRLFQPFAQAEAGTSRRYGGSGLGLAISQRLVGLMGGELTVRSEVGQGSTFSFSIPAPESELPGDEVLRVEPRVLPQLLVLLVDDNQVNRMVASAMLSRLGIEHEVVDGGLPALERLAQQPPIDLMLLDCQMPDLDGFETCRRLRAQGYTLPVLALTAGVTAEERERCLDSGMDAVVAKPVNLASLSDALESWGGGVKEVA